MNVRPSTGDSFNTHREGVAVRVAVPRETAGLERRVALVPESCKRLIQAGYDITVEAGAGAAAFYPDRAYQDAGAAVSGDRAALLREADLVLRVAAPPPAGGGGPGDYADIAAMRPGAILVGSLMPQRNLAVVRALARHCITAFSTDAIPRTTRAQTMDTLSSMASIAGYRGVLLAAETLPRYLPMLTTAAGMVPPAKVFVVGAAVAGLQAIATAKRLGATVTATDVRPEVKEEIESVGARYVGVEVAGASAGGVGGGGGYAGELSAADRERQRVLLAEQCAAADVVITTALIGGVFAPRIITAAMVRGMKPGSVLVDLAADGGGNCELSRPGETTVENGVTILAPLNVPAAMPAQASLLFSRNLTAFVQAFTRDKAFQLDPADEIQQGALITYDGQVLHARTKEALAQA